MPPKGEKRRKALEEALGGGRAAVLYEAPHRYWSVVLHRSARTEQKERRVTDNGRSRLAGTLKEMEGLGLGARRVMLGRELTKRHEERRSQARVPGDLGGEAAW
eukprot:1281859-Rhodomonas_salina.4